MRARRVGNAINSESLEVAGDKLNCLANDGEAHSTQFSRGCRPMEIYIFSILLHCA